jgi:hypothetical protein
MIRMNAAEWKARLQGVQRAVAGGDPEPLDIISNRIAELEAAAEAAAEAAKTPQIIPAAAEVSQASEQSQKREQSGPERTREADAEKVALGDPPSI